MWNSDSNAAKTSVTTIFSNLNRVYTGTVFQEMNIQFQAAKITLGLDVCSDRLAAVDSKACLLKFSQITNSTEYCLHYLFTYRYYQAWQQAPIKLDRLGLIFHYQPYQW